MKHSLPAILGGSKARPKPFAPHPIIGTEETKEVLGVLRSGVLSGFIAKPGDAFFGGIQVKRLEKLFQEKFNVKHCVAMNSATSALHAALWAVGVEPGDEVIVSPYTMSASASAIVMCGALPVFADIEAETYGLDPVEVEKKITKRTKAILVVHLFGHAAKMNRLLAIAKKYKLKVVEDCAQAPIATDLNRYVGTLGDVGVFSLNQHKTITTGEGGLAVTNSADLALKMQLIRNHGEVVSDHIPQAKSITCLGWNYRMTELEASVGIGQFKKLEMLTKHRIVLAEYLNEKLKKFDFLRLPVTRKSCRHVYFVYSAQFDAAKAGISRTLFVKALAAEGIGFGEGYVRPIYWEPMYQRRKVYQISNFPFSLKKEAFFKNYSKGSCPITEDLHMNKLISTGLCRYPLSIKDMDSLILAIEKVYFNATSIQKSLTKH